VRNGTICPESGPRRAPEALRVQEIARKEARDPLAGDLRHLRVAPEREPCEERELVGGVLALDVARRVGLGEPEALRVLQDVRVPDANLLPGSTTLRGPLSCLDEARFGIVFGAVGSARACFETALEYAKERIVFGKPISAYQLTQEKLAEMALEINRGSLVALHLGRMKDAGTLRPEQISMGKMGNVRGALEVARSARTVLGANGVTLEYPVIRHVNNLESVLTYEGTHEVHTLVVGLALTGDNAFR